MSDAPSVVLGVERSVTGRLWRSRGGDVDGADIARALDLPEIVGRVLAARGIGAEAAAAYLDPKLKSLLPDPSRFADMDKAAKRVAEAVMAGEPVGIFGDYDVDGATSSALLHRYLRAAGGKARVYIPDRIREGYGPNIDAFRKLGEEGIRLIVTVDCGALAFEVLEQARDLGLEIIVVDHHQTEERLPPALALVNPKRRGEPVEYDLLAAVGVAFLLAVGVNRLLRDAGWFGRAERPEPDLFSLLDLVALGTVCDVVPLKGVNRALVRQGLAVMRLRRNPGLAALADVAGVEEEPGAYHLGFLMGPRVNAGGRVGLADLGYRLLATDYGDEARTIAAELNELNRERIEIEAAMQREAMELVEREGRAEHPVIVEARSGWHPGVIGIVASRLKETYHRPTIVIALEDGVGKGSGRSIAGVDLGVHVGAARQHGLLVNGGGHAMAAGLTIEAGRIDELTRFLHERMADQVAGAGEARSLGIDGALAVTGAGEELVDTLELVGPFGASNAEPRFVLPSVRAVRADIVGADHVRCTVMGADGRGRLNCIAFRCGDGPLGQLLLDSQGAAMHLAGHLRANRWRGVRRVQFIIEDAAPVLA